MSNAEHTAEPSMEDILSSIRKIIAEEPAQTNPDEVAGQDPELVAGQAPEPVAELAADQAAPVAMSGAQNNVDQGIQRQQVAGGAGNGEGHGGPAAGRGFESNISASHGSAAHGAHGSAAHGSIEQLTSGLPGLQAGQDIAPVMGSIGGVSAGSEPIAATQDTLAQATPTQDTLTQAPPTDLNAFDALVAASAPTAVTATMQNDDNGPADPDDLDPLASLIEQAPDHMTAANVATGADQPSAAGIANFASVTTSNGKADLSDIAPAPVVAHDADDASEFAAPKPAELRGALTGRMGQTNPVAAPGLVAVPSAPNAPPLTTEGAQSEDVPQPHSFGQAQDQDDQIEQQVQPSEPPLSDLLQTLAGAQDDAPVAALLAVGDASTHAPDASASYTGAVGAAVEGISGDEAQAAVEASTDLSHEKLSETLTALNAKASDLEAGEIAESAIVLASAPAADSAAEPAGSGSDEQSRSMAFSSAFNNPDTGDGGGADSAPPVSDASVDVEPLADPAASAALDTSDQFAGLLAKMAVDTGGQIPAEEVGEPGPAEVIAATPPAAEAKQPETEQNDDLHFADVPPEEASPLSKDELLSSDAQLEIDAALPPATVANIAEETGLAVAADLENIDLAISTDLVPGGVRTMEDTVSELLRPMLRNWLDDNMPRILEKTLKLELAAAIEPDAENAADASD